MTRAIDRLQQQQNIRMGIAGNANANRDSSNGPSALQKQHLQHIVGTGRNSVNAIEDSSNNARSSLLTGSNM